MPSGEPSTRKPSPKPLILYNKLSCDKQKDQNTRDITF